MIRIITGYSNTGGSTVALINLTNQLNYAGYETILYGPHSWYLGKCQSEQYTPNTKMKLNKEDTVIFHFKNLSQRPPVKKVILVCHEKWWFQVGKINQYWDTAVFLHEDHYKYHRENGYNGNYCIIPNFKENLIKRDKVNLNKVAGIIGSIEDRKKTHISIQRALKDGCDKIYLFGNIIDENYFNFFVKPFLNDKVEYKGFNDNKQEVYDQIGRVYHSSVGEVASLVKDECYLTGTLFFGNEETKNDVSDLNNEEILNKWIKELDLFEPSNVNFNKKPKISAYFPCYNEGRLLPHLLKHYTSFCEKVTILDNYSTDNTEEIVKQFKNVTLEKFDSNGHFNDGVNAYIKNNCWKKDVGNFDYVIVADSDEFIWHPNFIEFIKEKKSKGYTLFRPFGYHMIADVDFQLKDEDDIFEKVKHGVKVISMDKYIMFDCNKIVETNFSVGSHNCNPVGEVKLYYKEDLKIKHFKYLGLQSHLEWCRVAKQRLSPFNIQNNMGTFYLEGDEYHTRDYMNYFNQRVII